MQGGVACLIAVNGPQYNPKNTVLPGDEPLTVPIYKKNIAIYKESLRPLIREANLYHILPRPDGVQWDGIEYYDAEKGKGSVMLYKPALSGGNNKNILLKGLDENRIYRFEFTDRPEQNLSMTGFAAMKSGLPVEMTGELVSEIILFYGR